MGWATIARTMVMITSVLVAAQLPQAAPASAVAGLEKSTSQRVGPDSVSPKTATAFCPPGKRVLGGGGWVFETSRPLTNKLTLTRLQPVHPSSGDPDQRDRYVVSGGETAPGISGDWWLQAYALCADPVPGLHIETVSEPSDSNSSLEVVARCPAGQKVLGTGGRILNGGFEVSGVVLQVARASGGGDLARVIAREDPDGFARNWSLTSYAVCANEPPAYDVKMVPSDQKGSESEKVAFVDCPVGTRVHGAGAAISNQAPGNVALQVIYPFENLTKVEAAAVENVPTDQDWDFIVAQAICAR